MFFRSPLFAVLLSALALAGCDSALTEALPSATSDVGAVTDGSFLALRIPLGSAPAGDFLYDLAPLATGSVFRGRLEFTGGTTADLRSTNTGSGTALALALGGLAPDSVTVDYLANGVAVAAPLTYRTSTTDARARDAGMQGETYPAGTSVTGPTSYHYEKIDGEIVLVKDYNAVSGPSAPGSRSAAGTPFMTTRGEAIRVTDVSFTLHGADAGAPTAVEFDAPTGLMLRWFELRR